MRIAIAALALAVVFVVGGVSLLLAFDTVVTKKGKTPTKGTVTEMTKDAVKITVNSVPNEIPVNDIRDIQYDEDSLEIKTARVAVRNGEYADAMASLNKINVADLARPFLVDDVNFYKSVCIARNALGSGNDKSKADATETVKAFVRAHPNSYHFYEAIELVGDLQVARNDFAGATQTYALLAKAPFPEYTMKATVLEGRALQAQPGKGAEALAKFEAVLANPTPGPLADEQKLHASLGKAVAMAQTGKSAEGIKILEGIIEKANPQTDTLLFARAYNAMGACYRADTANKEAVKSAQLAYLHVHLLFPQDPEQHAESLHYLAQLWDATNNPERAGTCRTILTDRYPGSRWAPKGM